MTMLRLSAFVMFLPVAAGATGPATVTLTPTVIAAEAAASSTGAQGWLVFLALLAVLGVNGS